MMTSMMARAIALLILLVPVASYAHPGHHHRRPRRVVVASWYRATKRQHTTANGETMHNDQLTAAHRTLPFGTKLKVTNVRNGRSAVVRVNDRGPFIPGRSLDVSPAAAQSLCFAHQGTARVTVRRVK